MLRVIFILRRVAGWLVDSCELVTNTWMQHYPTENTHQLAGTGFGGRNGGSQIQGEIQYVSLLEQGVFIKYVDCDTVIQRNVMIGKCSPLQGLIIFIFCLKPHIL